MSDIAIMIGGALLVGWSLVYGWRRFTGHTARLLLCGFCSCVTVGAIWLRMLPIVGFQTPSVGAQWTAMAAVAMFFRWGMGFLSRWEVE